MRRWLISLIVLGALAAPGSAGADTQSAALGNVTGQLSYVADQCLLGSCGKGFDLVSTAADKGHLDKEAKYRRKLRSFLRRTGYLA